MPRSILTGSTPRGLRNSQRCASTFLIPGHRLPEKLDFVNIERKTKQNQNAPHASVSPEPVRMF
jgi:hypothetical protein